MKRKQHILFESSTEAQADEVRQVTYDDLYVCRSTLQCAVDHQCIPCLYKIFPRGVFYKYTQPFDAASSRNIPLPPNQRPEQCHHAKHPMYSGLYGPGQRILTCGDGDFSFSLSLGEHVCVPNNAPDMLVATSHESRESVVKVYHPKSHSTLSTLRQYNIKILHGIDATALSTSASLRGERFDRVCWNFPCIGAGAAGADGQAKELAENRDLLRRFFRDVQLMLNPAGEVHVAHKTVEPFSWWNITTLAAESGLVYQGSVVFDRYVYPGYVNRKVLDRKSFPCHDARIYIFTAAQAIDSDNSAKKLKKKKHKSKSKTHQRDGDKREDYEDGLKNETVKVPDSSNAVTAARNCATLRDEGGNGGGGGVVVSLSKRSVYKQLKTVVKSLTQSSSSS